MRPILSTCLRVLFVVALGIGCAAPSHAQRIGVGGQLGEPSGVTLKLYNPGAPSYDFLAAWSLRDDEVFLNAHVLFEKQIQASNVGRRLEWFVGPGGFVEAASDGAVGISGTIGLDVALTDHISFYVRGTPRFALVPATEWDVGGGIGIRYFF